MKTPGPDHPITIEPHPGRIVVRLGDAVLADTTRALALKEADYPPVAYVPREDVDFGLLSRTAHRTHCPYKGDAAYFTAEADGRTAEDAVWVYEEPYPAVAAIGGHLAFYPDKIEVNGAPAG